MPEPRWGLLIVALPLPGRPVGRALLRLGARHLPAGRRRAGAIPGIARVGALLAPWPVSIGSALLVFDLGHWYRFYKLFVTFEWHSPMSIGAWLLGRVHRSSPLAAFWAWLPQETLDAFVREAAAAPALPALRRPAVARALAAAARDGRLPARDRRRHLHRRAARRGAGAAVLEHQPGRADVPLLGALERLRAADPRALGAPRRARRGRGAAPVQPRHHPHPARAVHRPARTSSTASCRRSRCSRRSTSILGGPFTFAFWGLFLGLGLLLPLALELWEMRPVLLDRAAVPPRPPARRRCRPLLVLVGGFVLRYVFVYAGQMSTFQ